MSPVATPGLVGFTGSIGFSGFAGLSGSTGLTSNLSIALLIASTAALISSWVASLFSRTLLPASIAFCNTFHDFSVYLLASSLFALSITVSNSLVSLGALRPLIASSSVLSALSTCSWVALLSLLTMIASNKVFSNLDHDSIE